MYVQYSKTLSMAHVNHSHTMPNIYSVIQGLVRVELVIKFLNE